MDEALPRLSPSGHGRARGLISSRVSGARVASQSYGPPTDLADVIDSFWMGRWNLPPDAPHVTELLGDPCVHIVVERGATRVVGVWTQRWINRLEGRGHVRAAKLRPGAVRAFFNVDATILSDKKRALADLLDGFDTAGFESAVLEDPDDRAAFIAMSRYLRQIRRNDPDVRLAVGCAHLLRDPGVTRVETLAARCGLSVRGLQRLFRRHVGAPPKALLRRVRLQEAALRIERGEATNLARLAAELGYTDQAHFTRDFRVAVGRTPRELDTSLYR